MAEAPNQCLNSPVATMKRPSIVKKTALKNAAAFTISPGIELPADGQVKSGAASFGAAVDGDAALGTFTLTTTDGFTADTEATITVSSLSIGPTSTDRDVFDAAALELSVTVNPPAPPVIEPTLSANSLTDVSLDYSAVGSGDGEDDSDGEIAFSVNFTDGTNDAGSLVSAGTYICRMVSNDFVSTNKMTLMK